MTSVQEQLAHNINSNQRLFICVYLRITCLRFSLSKNARRIRVNDLKVRVIVKHKNGFYTLTERGVAQVSAQNASSKIVGWELGLGTMLHVRTM